MKIVDRVVLPDPTPERRHMLTRNDAVRVFEAIEDAGFGCTLDVGRRSPGDAVFSVVVDLEGLDGHRLRDLQDAIEAAAPDATVAVGRQGYLEVS